MDSQTVCAVMYNSIAKVRKRGWYKGGRGGQPNQNNNQHSNGTFWQIPLASPLLLRSRGDCSLTAVIQFIPIIRIQLTITSLLIQLMVDRGRAAAVTVIIKLAQSTRFGANEDRNLHRYNMHIIVITVRSLTHSLTRSLAPTPRT